MPDVHIDVVELESAAPALQGQAVRDGVLLLDRERDARLAWEIDATRRWLDLAPWQARGEALRRAGHRADRGQMVVGFCAVVPGPD